MSFRAAVILFQDDKIALIERHRSDLHYFTYPGGHVEKGETAEQAAVRETEEELGIKVKIQKLLAEIWWHDKPQFYYLVEKVSGVFGTGMGEEILDPHPGRGTYKPVWVPVEALRDLPVLPRSMTDMVLESRSDGWPDPPPVIHDKE
jgi:8-oxo-dGTP diphosphatase